MQISLGGKRADLSYEDLRGKDLSYSLLTGADLSHANLQHCKLVGADLSEANLVFANMRYASAEFANFDGCALDGADLRLSSLEYASISHTSFFSADINKMIIDNAKNVDLARGLTCPLTCPEVGSFTGFKKVRSGYIVELLIPKGAKRSSSTGRKCRCDKAKVVSITAKDGSKADVTEVYSSHDKSFAYRVGEYVSVDNFDENRWNECAPGIHFFITRQEAVDYFCF